MVLSIKSDEADRLARELADQTGESITEAVTAALRERLDRTRRSPEAVAERLMSVASAGATLPILDIRSDDEILGYDEHGVPR
jgi:antitoxin VapB